MALNLGVLVGLGVTDEKVKVSADDTTASYLQSKIAAGSNITLTVLNDGANEQIQITAASGVSPSIGGAITSGTQYSVLFIDPSGTFAQDVANLNFNNSTNRLGIGTTASNARVDIKGEGLTSATSAIYIANATPTQMFYIKNNGQFVLGIGASEFDEYCVTIGRNSVTSQTGATAVGNGSAAVSYSFAGGYNTSTSSGGFAAVNGSASASGAVAYSSAVSGTQGTGMGSYSQVTATYGTAYGTTTEVTQQLGIAIGSNCRASASGAMVLAGCENSNFVNNSESNTLMIVWNSTNPSFRFNKNANFVLRSNSAITSATHYDANATNVVTIHDGTAPAGAITDACQVFTNADGQLQYMDDSGFTVTL